MGVNMPNLVVETYSRLADKYDDELNLRSCWGRAADKIQNSLVIEDDDRVVVDVGCGTGKALCQLASSSRPNVQLIGIEPAENMRNCAQRRITGRQNISILDGCFERMPLDSQSADYLFSIFAFHWVTDLRASVREIRRVLKPNGHADLFFIGRNNGHEFIRKTSPIFLKYMGPAGFLESARLRTQLTRQEAGRLFSELFEPSQVSVDESYETFYDSLEGHWGWWVRIEGQFISIPAEARKACDQEVRKALSELATIKGIPYSIHCLHLTVRPGIEVQSRPHTGAGRGEML
jgi:ubiquinone/menaquinone biosynthesis C-methylase UbiE